MLIELSIAIAVRSKEQRRRHAPHQEQLLDRIDRAVFRSISRLQARIVIDLGPQLGQNNVSLESARGSGADGDIKINEAVSWGANTLLTLNATNDIDINAQITATGARAGLVMNFGADYHINNIAVNSVIQGKPSLLSAAKNGEKGDNQSALAIAGLESAALDSLDGANLKQTYESMVNGVSTSASAAKTSAEAAAIIRQTLESQREALSGVSLDEEAINLIKQQRAFQGAAKLIATVNELMDVLLNIA